MRIGDAYWRWFGILGTNVVLRIVRRGKKDTFSRWIQVLAVLFLSCIQRS